MKVSLLILLILFSLSSFAQINKPDPNYKLVSGGNCVKAKNHYLLTLLEHDKAVNAWLRYDAELSKLVQTKLTAMQTSLKECKDALCLPGQLKFSNAEISAASARLKALYKTGNALGVLVTCL